MLPGGGVITAPWGVWGARAPQYNYTIYYLDRFLIRTFFDLFCVTFYVEYLIWGAFGWLWGGLWASFGRLWAAFGLSLGTLGHHFGTCGVNGLNHKNN